LHGGGEILEHTHTHTHTHTVDTVDKTLTATFLTCSRHCCCLPCLLKQLLSSSAIRTTFGCLVLFDQSSSFTHMCWVKHAGPHAYCAYWDTGLYNSGW